MLKAIAKTKKATLNLLLNGGGRGDLNFRPSGYEAKGIWHGSTGSNETVYLVDIGVDIYLIYVNLLSLTLRLT
ncbi:MAG: hypothetical protein JJ848_008195 [Prochlorococcus marinus CUG1439]|uniref:hypothetical protein n=1 Tax=Prochlorococcus sp. MIT 1314 TaxID=3096220 RepID=UPI001AFECCC0|nr:hypothetical protein [Prochlorococcus sp. MIT 1314]MCR8540316.1 hypothetical protein [Prochlorococcus marinus CUG1439]